MLVEGEPFEKDVTELREMIKEFVLNNGRDPESSDTPKDAIVSVKTDRGTTQEKFIEVLDQIQGAYYDMYAARIGVTNKEWREIASDLTDPENRRLYDEGRGLKDGSLEFPMNLSIAEPTKIGG
ncbi:MAG: biopolymer transporter ExbD, partial [Bacteroidota bacterium]